MRRRFANPSAIRRIAVRRVFTSSTGTPVVLTIGVPEPVPGSDWGCALQITGLKSSLARPRYVFGIDGLQALHMALKLADVSLESSAKRLGFLGEKGDLGMPKFLPELPRPHQRRLEAIVQREVTRFWRRLLRESKQRAARKRPQAKR